MSRSARKLTLADIVDVRAYERERDDFRTQVMGLKRLRRISVGPVVTVVFENRDTMRFQVQEMARAERMATDEQIQAELDIYNPLIPEPGELTATLFIELDSKDRLMEWLPKLVGIERSLQLRLPNGDVVTAVPDEDHAAQLTREDITASVHYIRFTLTPEQVDAFARGPAVLAVDHPNYNAETVLSDDTRASLLTDLQR
jgi:hypothetical protein